MPFLVALKEVKLRTFVTPGQSLTVAAKLAHEGSGYMVTDAEITAEGKPICNANITFRLMGFPSPRFRASMEEVAERIAFPRETVAHG
jgi:3-hydroxyacyl-[acyl-carrier-protein] dehydratase